MRALRHTGLIVASVLLLGGVWPGTLLAQGTAPDQRILLYQRMLQRNSQDARTYHRLGDAYIQKARESGDVTYFDLAERALRKALEIQPRYSDARRHLAFVLYSRHDFAGAASEAAKAIALHPGDSHGYGILGDAYLETGQYVLAAETYETMLQHRADLYSLSRRAGLRALRGDAEGAIADLKQAIEDGRTSGPPRESVAWAQWQLGSDYFALGNLPAAEAQYLEALTTYPGYHRGLAGLAQVRAAQERYLDAIELYQKALAIIPLPEYAAPLGDVFTRLGRPEEARRQYELVEYIGHLSALNQVLYNRELAYFYADHDLKLHEALDLARKELEVRQDIYAYDLLAWALYKNGKPQEARVAMREALRLGTRDARLFFHAGMIAAALGEREEARAHLRRALDTNPHFHLLHAEAAGKTLQDLDREASPVAGR